MLTVSPAPAFVAQPEAAPARSPRLPFVLAAVLAVGSVTACSEPVQEPFELTYPVTGLRAGADDRHWTLDVEATTDQPLTCRVGYHADRIELVVTDDPPVTFTPVPDRVYLPLLYLRQVDCVLTESPAGRQFVDAGGTPLPR